MHNNSYNVKVGCISSKNFIKSLEEVKSFFGFKLVDLKENTETSINNSCNAVIFNVNLIYRSNLLKMLLSTIFIFTKYFQYVKYVLLFSHKQFLVKLIQYITCIASNDLYHVCILF